MCFIVDLFRNILMVTISMEKKSDYFKQDLKGRKNQCSMKKLKNIRQADIQG